MPMRHSMFRLARLSFGLLVLLMALPCAAFSADATIGTVITLTPGATMLRDGTTQALALHAGIRLADSISTDAGGRVKILFSDDSSVSLGPNTTLDMNEYADAGSASTFGIHVPQGMVRAITGRIVDQNPGGFTMSSPEATVGIRGTIVTMHVERGQGGRMRTTVYVENTLRRVHVNGDDVPSGNKWIREDGASRQERIAPEDRRHIGRELAFRGGAGSAAAAPEGAERGQRRSARFGDGGGLVPENDDLKNDPQIAQAMLNPTLPVGRVTGTLTDTAVTGSTLYSGSFSFAVDLATGAISNGTINHSLLYSGDVYSAALSGGTGQADAVRFLMNASGVGYYNNAPVAVSGEIHNTQGAVDLLSAPDGTSFSVGYDIEYNSPSPHRDSGTGIGTISK